MWVYDLVEATTDNAAGTVENDWSLRAPPVFISVEGITGYIENDSAIEEDWFRIEPESMGSCKSPGWEFIWTSALKEVNETTIPDGSETFQDVGLSRFGAGHLGTLCY